MQWVVCWVYPHRHHQTHMSNAFQLNIIIASLLLRDRNFSAASQPHGTTLLHAIRYCSKGNFALLPKSLWLESTLESAFLKKKSDLLPTVWVTYGYHLSVMSTWMDTWRPYARARSVLCLVSKADEQIFKHFIGADTWKPATVTMALHHGNRDFL